MRLALISRDWASVSAGGNYTLGRKNNGIIWSWGANEFGQLGLGDTGINRITPTQIGTVPDWFILDAGNSHAGSLKTKWYILGMG